MADEPATGVYIGDRLEITPDGVYIDGTRLPVSGHVSVDTIDDDYHIVSVRLLVKRVDAPDNPLLVASRGVTYRRVYTPETLPADNHPVHDEVQYVNVPVGKHPDA